MTLTDEIKTAMKAKDTTKLSTLRMLKAAVQNAEIEKKKELEPNEFIGVVRKEIKKRQDTISMVGRLDMPEFQEIKLLEAFLPQQLGSEELALLVAQALQEVDAKTIKDMGKAMKRATELIAGRADGKEVSTLIKTKLS